MTATVSRLYAPPVRAAICAIDPGATSGVACMAQDALVWSFVCPATERKMRDDLVWKARTGAEEWGIPLLFVMEHWSGHGRWGFKTFAGLVEHAGRWLDSIETICPKAPVVRVFSSVWSGRVLKGMPHTSTEDRRSASVQYVRNRFKVDAQHDEAAAVCMAVWGSRDPDMATVVEKMRRRRKR